MFLPSSLRDPPVDIFAGIVIEEKIKNDFLKYIKGKLATQPVKIRTDFDITCYSYEGIGK